MAMPNFTRRCTRLIERSGRCGGLAQRVDRLRHLRETLPQAHVNVWQVLLGHWFFLLCILRSALHLPTRARAASLTVAASLPGPGGPPAPG